MTTTPTSGAADLRDTLINIAREIEALKRECGMDPESPIAIQNGRYMALSYKVRALAAQPAGAQQPAPSAAVASKAMLAAIRAANMQLVRTGDDEFMLVTLKQATPQADSQPAPDEIINMAREQGLPETEIEGVFRVNADDLCRVAAAILAARAPADSVLEDAARWQTFIALPYATRAEWASNLSLAPVLTQWVDAALKQGENHD